MPVGASDEVELLDSDPRNLTAPDPTADGPSQTPLELCLMAVSMAARDLGAELDREDLRLKPGQVPSPAALAEWVGLAGLWCRAVRLSWRELLKLKGAGSVVLLMRDGSGAVMARPDPVRNVVWLKDPAIAVEQDGVPIDELRLSQLWAGE